MSVTFEFLHACLNYFVSFDLVLFCFFLFLWRLFLEFFLKWLIHSFSFDGGEIDIHLGHVRLLLIEATTKLWDALIQRLVFLETYELWLRR